MSDTPAGPIRSGAYRALILEPSGDVVAIEPLIAADDQEALALSQAMVDGHAVELWDGLRFIEHFEPEHMTP